MKTIILVALLCFVSVYTYNGHYPRSDVSCDGNVNGMYWDGQKCAECANSYCYCKDYLGCDKCEEGYSLHKIENLDEDEDNITKCYQCPANVKDCCFHGESVQFKIKENRILNDQDIANQFLIRRALACNTNIQENSIYAGEQRRYGSYCHFENGCLSYNNYGQCYSCAKGYFMSGTTYSFDGVKACDYCSSYVANCSECNAKNQCDVCRDGYYLATNDGRVTHDDNIYASQCKLCNSNCLCSGKIGENDQPAKCDLGCKDPERYFKDESDPANPRCTIVCPSMCSKCELDKENSVAVCTECYSTAGGKFYADKINSEKQCVECPSHCHKCTLNSDGTPTCITEHCNNGYYEKTSSSGVITCSKCSSTNLGVQHVMRCNGNAKKYITQCNGDNIKLAEQSISSADPKSLQNKYLLVNAGKDNADCVDNKNFCKTITKDSGTNALCSECFKGYILGGDKKCKQCNSLSGCTKCESLPDATPYFKCVECQSGKDISTYIPLDDDSTQVVNYILSENTGSCVACSKGCLSCTNAGSNNCDPGECQSGYYFEEQQGALSCKRCIANCRSCSDGDDCTECWSGYTLWSSNSSPTEYKCVKCPDNCKECGQESSSAENNRKTCTVCNTGYYLANGVCHEPRKNCMSYEDNGACIFCEYKYRVIDGYCFPAISKEQGYINIEYACGSDHRIRDDGDLLNRSQFEDYVIPISSQILSASALLFALLLTVF